MLAIVHEVSFVAARQTEVARERVARIEFTIARFRIAIWQARLVAGVIVARVEIHIAALRRFSRVYEA